MSGPTLVPAIPKIQKRLHDRGLSVNAFEREVKLGTGVGSRLLRGEYRPKVAAVLRIQSWSDGDVTPRDWLTQAEAEAQAVIDARRAPAAEVAA